MTVSYELTGAMSAAAAAAAAAARCPTDRCISAAVSQSVVEVAYQGDGRHAAATSHCAVSDDGPARCVLARRSHLTHLTATSHCAVSDDGPARRVLARRSHPPHGDLALRCL